MSHWPFILAAYGLAAAGTLALVLWSWAQMRRAEAEADRIGRDR
jgi:hypothetical protein